MSSSSTLGRTYTLFLALFLCVEGIWGLVDPPVFGLLPTNLYRALIHLVFGLLGLAAVKAGSVYKYLQLVGWVMLVVGAIWFIPFVKQLVTGLLAVDKNVAILNVVLGILTLVVSRGEKHLVPREPRDRKAYNLPH